MCVCMCVSAQWEIPEEGKRAKTQQRGSNKIRSEHDKPRFKAVRQGRGGREYRT